jgi:hypothetical protein
LRRWLKKLFGIEEGGEVPQRCPKCGYAGNHMVRVLENGKPKEYFVCHTGKKEGDE